MWLGVEATGQEDSERSSDEARQCEAEAALDLSQLAALSLGQPLLVAIDHDRVVVFCLIKGKSSNANTGLINGPPPPFKVNKV